MSGIIQSLSCLVLIEVLLNDVFVVYLHVLIHEVVVVYLCILMRFALFTCVF